MPSSRGDSCNLSAVCCIEKRYKACLNMQIWFGSPACAMTNRDASLASVRRFEAHIQSVDWLPPSATHRIGRTSYFEINFNRRLGQAHLGCGQRDALSLCANKAPATRQKSLRLLNEKPGMNESLSQSNFEGLTEERLRQQAEWHPDVAC